MNTAYILLTVCARVPDAKNVRIEPAGGKVFALFCEIDGRARCVQFTSCGLYGDGQYGWHMAPKSDEELATVLVLALTA